MFKNKKALYTDLFLAVSSVIIIIAVLFFVSIFAATQKTTVEEVSDYEYFFKFEPLYLTTFLEQELISGEDITAEDFENLDWSSKKTYKVKDLLYDGSTTAQLIISNKRKEYLKESFSEENSMFDFFSNFHSKRSDISVPLDFEIVSAFLIDIHYEVSAAELVHIEEFKRSKGIFDDYNNYYLFVKNKEGTYNVVYFYSPDPSLQKLYEDERGEEE